MWGSIDRTPASAEHLTCVAIPHYTHSKVFPLYSRGNRFLEGYSPAALLTQTAMCSVD